MFVSRADQFVFVLLLLIFYYVFLFLLQVFVVFQLNVRDEALKRLCNLIRLY